MQTKNLHEDARYQCALSMEACKAGDVDKAIEILYNAIERWPDFFQLYNDLGCIFTARGPKYWINGRKCFERAVALNPNDANAAANLAKTTKIMTRLKGPSCNGVVNVDYNKVYRYEGYMMETKHCVPWAGDRGSAFFLKASEDAVNFELADVHQYHGITMAEKIYLRAWNNWVVTYAMRHAIEFTKKTEFESVECGVCDGLSAFFAMRELQGHLESGRINSFRMHLYDSWAPMREEGLTEWEKKQVGNYADNDVERTKRNLSEFADNAVYHQGFIPEVLRQPPEPPETISYIHIDVNSAKSTVDVLEFYFPRLLEGGVVLFDDHGWLGFNETREAVLKFFEDKPGLLMPSPTGQAIYYR